MSTRGEIWQGLGSSWEAVLASVSLPSRAPASAGLRPPMPSPPARGRHSICASLAPWRLQASPSRSTTFMWRPLLRETPSSPSTSGVRPAPPTGTSSALLAHALQAATSAAGQPPILPQPPSSASTSMPPARAAPQTTSTPGSRSAFLTTSGRWSSSLAWTLLTAGRSCPSPPPDAWSRTSPSSAAASA